MADKKPAPEKKTEKRAEKKNDKKAQKAGALAHIKGWFRGIGKYFKDTRSELKKVVWPSRKETKNNTIVVVVVVVVAAAFMVVLDMLFGGAIHLMIGA